MKYETEQAAVKLAAAILIAVAVTCGGCLPVLLGRWKLPQEKC